MPPPRDPARARRTRRLAWAGLAIALATGASVAPAVGMARVERLTLRVLAHLPASRDCARPLGALAALAQGEGLGAEGCHAELARGRVAGPLLERIARDGANPPAARISALDALIGAGRAPPGLVDALLVAPPSAPTLRLAAADVVARGAEGDVWTARAGAAALHGLYDRAMARAFAAGERDGALPLRDALAAHAVDPVVLADVYAGLGIDQPSLEEATRRHARGQLPLGMPTEWRAAFWRHGCEQACIPLLRDLLSEEARRRGEEPGEPPPTAPGADAALDVLYASDGPAGDHVRHELAAVAGWIGAVSEPRRAARLVAAVLHPEAVPLDAVAAAVEAGDPHAALVRGGGAPGATALVVNDLALAARVPVTTWLTERGVALQVAGRLHEVAGCAAPRPVSAPGAEWREVPHAGVDALVLVEAAANALRAGDPTAARARIDAARAAWGAAPGLDALEGAVLAREGAPAAEPPAPLPRRRGRAPSPPADPAPIQVGPLVGVPGADVLFVSRPVFTPRGRRAPAPAPDLRAAVRDGVAAHVARILALATEPGARLRAAWWALDGGHAELSRRLLAATPEPGLLDRQDRPIRAVIAGALGEPAAVTATVAPPCPRLGAADPPPAAWAAPGPTGVPSAAAGGGADGEGAASAN